MCIKTMGLGAEKNMFPKFYISLNKKDFEVYFIVFLITHFNFR